MRSLSYNISVGARSSLLSRAQVEEVHRELRQFTPHVTFWAHWITTQGDLDKITSLKQLDNPSFFTDEIDLALREKKIRVAIHSAKDLPNPLPLDFEQVALTQGLTQHDSLVMNHAPLPYQAKIGTSSLRRELEIKKLREDFIPYDIRGTIEERLLLLDQQELHGVVIAECALIRLNLTHRMRIQLPGVPLPLQGKLAVIARKGDIEMKTLFAPLNSS
ncbi:MAG: hydroxymethylbilane synthase [Candidatus Rhabdochlamydia sp.]